MFRFFICLMVVFSLMSVASFAAQSEQAQADQAKAVLITAADTIGQDTRIKAVINIDIGQGWHTYWKYPGDAGLPPRLDWSASENVENVTMHYMAPKRMKELDFITFGYPEKTSFPIDIQLKEGNTKTALNFELEIMICKDICIPQTLSLHLDMEAGDGQEDIDADHVKHIYAQLPVQDNIPALKIENIVVSNEAIVVNVYDVDRFENFDGFVVVGDQVLTQKPEIMKKAQDTRRAMVKFLRPEAIEDLNHALAGQDLEIICVSGTKSLHKKQVF